MRRFLLIIVCFYALPAMGSHIVGGEFLIRYIKRVSTCPTCQGGGGVVDSIKLILYFDKKNGNPGAKDLSITAAIFRKSDNAFMRFVNFLEPDVSKVNYSQPECSHGEIQTDKLVYSTIVTLADVEYDDPEGYYIVWERCCRNYTITNIFSQDTQLGGIGAGQTFFLEFPPIVKNGEPFINSSPRLFPPLNDYACPRKPYFVDFAGIDDDGDSLTYTLVTPYSTQTTDPVPPLNPLPYPPVLWRNPFSIDNILSGNPDLKISLDGLLTATPTKLGLYVFAVRCDEFRDGIKIGEVRRDFQMLVVDNCPVAEPPKILGRKLPETNFTYDNNMDVTFGSEVSDANRCIEVQVSDPDASKLDDNFTEHVTIKAIALSFKKDISGILPSITNATLTQGSTANFKICFDQCPYIEGPFLIGIVAFDDACSQPLFDTLKIMVNITPPPNENVKFITPNAVTNASITEGELAVWDIFATDGNKNPIIESVFTDGFNMADYGMELKRIKNADGEYRAQLIWDPRCDVYDFSHKTFFQVKIKLEDDDLCDFIHPAVVTFNLHILFRDHDPIISHDPIQLSSSDLTFNTDERRVEGLKRKLNESLHFNVLGTDEDNDFLVLSAKGIGFNMANYNITFPGDQNISPVSSVFNWDIACDNVNLDVKDEFEFEFIVVDDQNRCRLYRADTLNVSVKLYPQDNLGPKLSVTNLNPAMTLTIDNSLDVTLGQQIELDVTTLDSVLAQADMLHLELLEATTDGTVPPQGYSFTPSDALSEVHGIFKWKPDCSIFANNDYENNYTFTFLTIDDRCFNQKADTIEVDIKIKDVDGGDTDFLPPNFISPNGDEWNEFFAMVKVDPDTEELISILPKDNCTGRFVEISIFNRWGKKVYSSGNRDFKWYADGEASGVYYYLLKYSDKEYKGVINVRY
ncbi:MAG: gliding motility-associated C-terminal domain-containing protein [Chryseolinea sp.]